MPAGVELIVPAPAPALPAVSTKASGGTTIGVKFAVTDMGACTLTSAHVVPTQSPLKLSKEKPAAGVAMQVLVPPWSTGSGVQVIVPPSTGLAVAVMGNVMGTTMIGEKVAVTLAAATTLARVHVAPTQSPLKALKVKPAAAVAVQV